MKFLKLIIIVFKDVIFYFYIIITNIIKKYWFIYNDIYIKDIGKISSDTKIGKYTYIGYNTNITKSVIGKYCSIANNVSIGMGEHDLNKISTNSIFYDNQYKKLTEKDCIIGNDVWIGVDSIIRRGIKIGNGAIIGANTFVNSDIPAYAIAVGSPAKIIKYRFLDDKIKKIEESKWWEKDKEIAKEIIDKLN